MTTPVRARIDWVDRARALSILMVVLLHARIELAFLGASSPTVEFIVNFASTMRMPLFFAASGLFAVSWVERRSWREVFSKKLILLLWVFLIWQPVVFAYKVAEMLFLPDQPDNTLGTQFAKVVLSPLRPNGELWFLWALALFFVLAKLTARAPIWVRVGLPALFSVVWMSVASSVPEGTLRIIGDGWEGALKYYVFFAAAVAFSPRILRFYNEARLTTLLVLLTAWVTVGGLTSLGIITMHFPGGRFALCLLGVIGGFALARLLRGVPGLSRIGSNTLPIYVAHIPIIVACTVPLWLLGAAPAIRGAAGLSVLLLAAVAVAGAWWLHRGLIRTRAGSLMYAPPARLVRWASRTRNEAAQPS
ncbi:acyltransferase family protein [Microbacterium testaceum]|uniref:acyltransferase family protein n=1 Tax=Microbacterium testaceum TaxID=2033 RepID=UPI000734F132|nr:acyltransferase family protein [Microbacterium testaceum]